jgi:hypothetical protein
VHQPLGRYHPFDGDGMIHQIDFSGGKASYRNRFVRTRCFQAEQEAEGSLWGGLMDKASVSLRPDHFGSANAIGAAIAQVSGEVDRVVALEGTTREKALEGIVAEARLRAVEAGANPNSLQIAELEETPLSYLPGNAVRIAAKVVGDLAL